MRHDAGMTDPTDRAIAFTDVALPERYERLLAPSLFEPWAEVLLDAVGVAAGASVLDVAAGTGVVTRAAARRAGPSGRVVSTDISPAMIAFNASHPGEAGAAPIETAVASATDLGRDGGEFDVVVCQQGMPFFPDRPGAVAEMHRVLRPGGLVGIALWTPGHDVLPFGPMNSVLAELGAPVPGGDDVNSYALDADQVAALMSAAGFTAIHSREVELVTHWASVDAMVAAVHGTPFGVLLDALDPPTQERARDMMSERYSQWATPSGRVEASTYSVIARGVA